MSRTQIIAKVKRFVELIKTDLPLKMVILQKSYPGEEDKLTPEIDVVVVVDILEEEDDYVQRKLTLERIAEQISSKMDVEIIEEEKGDITGFYESLKKSGEVIYSNI